MYLKELMLDNYTVFKQLQIELSKGINVFIGENGTGKTHILKLLYAACQAADAKNIFSQKLITCMLPDGYKIAHLVHRGALKTDIHIIGVNEEASTYLSLEFFSDAKKWDSVVGNEPVWERIFAGTESIFIPAKEILSNCYQLSSAVARNNVKFDDTYLDIIDAAKVDVSKPLASYMVCEGQETYGYKNKLLQSIEQLVGGAVIYDAGKDTFYLDDGYGKLEFNLVAEGIRKLALLWQLVKNGALEKGSVLFWDEPEANMNPAYIVSIAEILLLLQEHGVQVFVSTHDYLFAKYLEIRQNDKNSVLFHSLYKKDGNIEYECGAKFTELKNNAIVSSFNALLDEVYDLGV